MQPQTQIYHARGLAVRFISKISVYGLFSLSSVRLTSFTWATPLEPSFMLVSRTWCHIFELSRITGTVSDMRSTSYRESIAQELAAHLAKEIKMVNMFMQKYFDCKHQSGPVCVIPSSKETGQNKHVNECKLTGNNRTEA